jgi:ankyrin repeat protein
MQFDQSDFLPIHLAASRDDSVTVQRLIHEQHVDKNIQDADGQTALHVAAQYGSIGVIVLLVVIEHVDIHIPNESQETPLHRAANYGQFFAVKALVQHGASRNATDEFGSSVLHHACDGGNLQIVKYLIEKGATPFVENLDRLSPLDVARNHSHRNVVDWLDDHMRSVPRPLATRWRLDFDVLPQGGPGVAY